MKKTNKKQLLQSLKKDYRASETFHDEEMAKIKQRRAEYDGDLYGNEQEGRSKIVSRDIKRQSEWQHAALLDPFVSNNKIIKATPVTWEDEESARQNELLLNTQFCRQFDRYNFLSKAIKVLDREGTVVVQTGWDYEDETVEEEVEVVVEDEDGIEYIEVQTEKVVKVIKNKPTAKVLRNEDVFIDPTCMGDLENAQFIVYRYETDLSTLKQDGRYKNLNKIKPSSEDADSDPDYRSEHEDVDDFKFEDDPRKKLVVYEYWGNYDVDGDGIAEPIVCAWVGDTVIRLQDNPYPDKKIPFLVVPFNSVPFEVYGESNGDLVSDNQKIKTAITRGIIDNMAQSNNGQKGIKKGALDTINRKKFLSGQNFEYNGSTAEFYDGSYNQIPGSAFDMLALMNNEIESLTGIKSFSGGINSGSLGSTATGARGAMDATATRRMNIVRNIAENLVNPLMRKWMSYNAEFLEEEEVVRVTNDNYVEVRRDDLQGRIDIELDISVQEDNAAKSQELSFLLQTVGPNEDPTIRRELMADIMELMRMPDQAKRVREYQPQPDPMEEQAKQMELQRLQLELQKLEAEIQDEHARAGENKIDQRLKLAKAKLEEAKAGKMFSEKELNDLKFLKEDGQYDKEVKLEELQLQHKQEMEKKMLEYEMNQRAMQYQALNNDNQIGVLR